MPRSGVVRQARRTYARLFNRPGAAVFRYQSFFTNAIVELIESVVAFFAFLFLYPLSRKRRVIYAVFNTPKIHPYIFILILLAVYVILSDYIFLNNGAQTAVTSEIVDYVIAYEPSISSTIYILVGFILFAAVIRATTLLLSFRNRQLRAISERIILVYYGYALIFVITVGFGIWVFSDKIAQLGDNYPFFVWTLRVVSLLALIGLSFAAGSVLVRTRVAVGGMMQSVFATGSGFLQFLLVAVLLFVYMQLVLFFVITPRSERADVMPSFYSIGAGSYCHVKDGNIHLVTKLKNTEDFTFVASMLSFSINESTPRRQTIDKLGREFPLLPDRGPARGEFLVEPVDSAEAKNAGLFVVPPGETRYFTAKVATDSPGFFGVGAPLEDDEGVPIEDDVYMCDLAPRRLPVYLVNAGGPEE